jgi:probable addiction module antidote protein
MSKSGRPYKEFLIEQLKKDPKLVVEYVRASFEENWDMPEALLSALRAVAEATGFEELASRAQLSSKSLYKILSDKRESQPRFETVYRLLDALGLRLTVEPKPRRKRANLNPSQRTRRAS